MEYNCQELLLTSLNEFYIKNNNYKNIFKTIISGNHKLSLRLIDWLVTHYSRNNNIYYWKLDNDKIYYNLPSNDNRRFKKINIYLDYRAQLKSYTKLNFDTFRRHHRISFYINDKDKIETTTGQLNFFRWAFSNNIIEYAINNYNEIYNNMIKSNNYKKKIKKKKKKKNIFKKLLKQIVFLDLINLNIKILNFIL